MKGHKYSMGGTHGKIEADMRRHRKSGGSVESDRTGDDDAAKDLKDKPTRRLNSKINDEAEATKAKRGGSMKAEGKKCRANGGRLPRASGGGCESNPFTSANKGTPARGRGGSEGVEKMTMGRD
jgi:hypothetical protein